jgi:hypothetical protein
MITADLKDAGWRVSENTAAALIAEQGLGGAAQATAQRYHSPGPRPLARPGPGQAPVPGGPAEPQVVRRRDPRPPPARASFVISYVESNLACRCLLWRAWHGSVAAIAAGTGDGRSSGAGQEAWPSTWMRASITTSTRWPRPGLRSLSSSGVTDPAQPPGQQRGGAGLVVRAGESHLAATTGAGAVVLRLPGRGGRPRVQPGGPRQLHPLGGVSAPPFRRAGVHAAAIALQHCTDTGRSYWALASWDWVMLCGSSASEFLEARTLPTERTVRPFLVRPGLPALRVHRLPLPG